jgi:hypothetical protein
VVLGIGMIFQKIKKVLAEYPNDKNTVVIHGGCKGADSIGGYLAKQFNMTVEVYKADWKLHGKSAGPKRNQQMLDEGKPDLAYAFHEDINNSKGTKDMISRCKSNNIPIEIIT